MLILNIKIWRKKLNNLCKSLKLNSFRDKKRNSNKVSMIKNSHNLNKKIHKYLLQRYRRLSN